MRLILFLVAFVIAVALSAPLDRWLLPILRRPLAEAGADLRVGSLRLALPAGIRATDVGVETETAGIDIDSLYVGITRAFEAEACGGRIRGRLSDGSLAVELADVNPSQCLRIAKLALEGTLDGSLSLDGVQVLDPRSLSSITARIDVTSAGGVFRGSIPHAGQGGDDLPLGEWEFSDLVLRASLAGGELTVDEGHTLTSGVEWQIVGASLPAAGSKGGLRVDFRARQVEDNPRSRALVGLMPKTTVDAGGWRNYRVTGSLASPRVVGVD